MQRLCYTTGTFDMVHKGHIEFLKACKQIVDAPLIIGLTTDELAIQQKRKTIMSYEHRRDILQEFPFVSAVIPHRGEPKQEAYERLRFTDLVIEVEYRGSPEYKCMEKFVNVIYIPGPLSRIVSSTNITSLLDFHSARNFQVLANGGPSGLIFKFDGYCKDVVLKPIRVTVKEYGHTRNAYNLPVPNPRNWKRKGEKHIHPNLPGVNAMRELLIGKLLDEYKWYPVIDYDESYVDLNEIRSSSDMNEDKTKYSKAIYMLRMRYAGDTLEQWIMDNRHKDLFIENLTQIVYNLKQICEALQSEGVVHGDIHNRNICVEPVYNTKTIGVEQQVIDYRVSLVDFGWCLCRNFELDEAEKDYLEQCLHNNFDYRHFKDSMEYSYGETDWFESLRI